jgi:hypothetical protein
MNNALKMFIPGLIGILSPFFEKRGIVVPAGFSDWITTLAVFVSGLLASGARLGVRDLPTTTTGVIGGAALALTGFGLDVDVTTQAALAGIVVTLIAWFSRSPVAALPQDTAAPPGPFSLLALLLALLPVGCDQGGIEKSLARGAVGLRAARQVVSVQFREARLSDQSYRELLTRFRESLLTLDELGDRIVALGVITPGNRNQILTELDRLLESFDALAASGKLILADRARGEFQSGVLIGRTALSALRLVIAAVDKPVPATKLKVAELFPVWQEALNVRTE